MELAPDHLIFQLSDHLFGVKRAALTGNLAMKNNLMQKIAELFAQFAIIRAVEGFQELVALLPAMRTSRRRAFVPCPKDSRFHREARP